MRPAGHARGERRREFAAGDDVGAGAPSRARVATTAMIAVRLDRVADGRRQIAEGLREDAIVPVAASPSNRRRPACPGLGDRLDRDVFGEQPATRDKGNGPCGVSAAQRLG